MTRDTLIKTVYELHSFTLEFSEKVSDWYRAEGLITDDTPDQLARMTVLHSRFDFDGDIDPWAEHRRPHA
jgi:hypothetical protein